MVMAYPRAESYQRPIPTRYTPPSVQQLPLFKREEKKPSMPEVPPSVDLPPQQDDTTDIGINPSYYINDDVLTGNEIHAGNETPAGNGRDSSGYQQHIAFEAPGIQPFVEGPTDPAIFVEGPTQPYGTFQLPPPFEEGKTTAYNFADGVSLDADLITDSAKRKELSGLLAMYRTFANGPISLVHDIGNDDYRCYFTNKAETILCENPNRYAIVTLDGMLTL